MTLRYSTLTACLVIWLGWLPSLAVYAETQDASEDTTTSELLEASAPCDIFLQPDSESEEMSKLSGETLILYKQLTLVLCKEFAIQLNEQAFAYYKQGKYTEAEPLYQRSFAIAEEVYGKEHSTVAAILNNMAELYRTQGDYARAEPLHQRALTIREKVFGKEPLDKEHLDVAQSLNNLAGIYYIQGNYARAEPLLQRALAIREEILDKEHPDVAQSLNNLAELYKAQGDYARAEPLHQRALAIKEKVLGKEHPAVATSLDNLAKLYDAQSDYVRAEPLFQRALAIRETVLGTEHPDVARSLNNLAALYQNQGYYARAEPLYQRSLAIKEKVLDKEHPDVAHSLYNLAGLYHAQGDYARAEPLLKRALNIAEHSGQPELLWKVQGSFSGLLIKQNKPAVAIFFGKRAVNTLQKLRANVTKEFQKSFLKDKVDVYKYLANLLIDQGRLPEAEQVLAMLKQEEYFDFIRRDAQDDPRTTQASFTTEEQPWAKRYEEIHTQLAGLGRELGELLKRKNTLTNTEKARVKQLKQDMTVANQAFETFLDELRQYFEKVPANRANFDEKDLRNLKSLQGTLGELSELGHSVVLVTYLMTKDKLRIMLTTPNVRLARDASVTEKQLNQTIAQFRDALKDRRADTQDLAKELYDWLIKPVANDLAQVQPTVLMVYLDSTLRYIPLAALHDGSHYLAEKYAVVMYTAAAHDKLKDQPKKDWKLAGLGLTQKIAGFDQLTGVEQELRVVRRSPEDKEGVIDGVVYFNQDFTAERMSDLLLLKEGYPVMHISSHFRFSPTGNETTSFLLLGDGNKLTLADIRDQYQFPHIDLLTLSACDTAIGTQGTGKEIESFGVIAQQNSAKSVLASLWPVYDISTAVFMRHLYRLRNTGTTPLNKALALQAAQRVFIEGKEGKMYQHPYYWAPFILMGNWL
jgi:CHAT domain-containing protein/Flp pilus assembly protein TadD